MNTNNIVMWVMLLNNATTEIMFESRISAGAKEKPPTRASGKPDAETISSWSYDMEGHARNALQDIANWRIKQLNNHTKSRRHVWMITNLKMQKLDQFDNCPQFAHKLFKNFSTVGSYW